jgi:hypothetical protein
LDADGVAEHRVVRDHTPGNDVQRSGDDVPADDGHQLLSVEQPLVGSSAG